MDCATSCHTNGPSQTNETVTLTSDIPASGYVPGTTYTLTLTAANGGSKFGFQISPQNASGTLLGTLIASNSSETQLVGSNKYLTHKLAGTSGSGTKSWEFQWTAPASGTGEVTFYHAVNFASNSNAQFEDVIVSGSTAFQEASVGISEAELRSLAVYPNPVIDEIHVAALDVDEEIMITLFNIEGKKVLEEKHDGGNITIDVRSRSLNSGMYFLQLEVDGKSTVQKLLVK